MIYEGRYAVLSIGDSRAYYVWGLSGKLLTRDDVWENSYDVANSFTTKEIMCHPNRGKLLKAVGKQSDIAPEITTAIVKPKTRFLLCSDGLYKHCPEGMIFKLMRKADRNKGFKDSISKFLDVVYKDGASDNISIILAEVM